jgi:hypothetical protein
VIHLLQHARVGRRRTPSARNRAQHQPAQHGDESDEEEHLPPPGPEVSPQAVTDHVPALRSSRGAGHRGRSVLSTPAMKYRRVGSRRSLPKGQ